MKLKFINKGWAAMWLAVAIGLMVVGCTSQDSPSKEAGASGGELSYLLAGAPRTLQAGNAGLDAEFRVLRSIFDNLVYLTEKQEVIPWLATTWSVSDDGLRYTFHLREDVTFHDGTPLNAEAVKFNFDQIAEPATHSYYALSLIGQLESVEAIDSYTVVFNLRQAVPDFVKNLSHPVFGIGSPTAATTHGDQINKHPVGSGPFSFVEWRENEWVRLAANPHYNWGPEAWENQAAPYLEAIVFRLVPEDGTRIGSLLGGQSLIADTIPPQNYAALQSDDAYSIHRIESLGLPYTLFLNTRIAPWNEQKARQAVQLGVDLDQIVTTLYQGTYSRAWSPLAPGTFGYDASLEQGIATDREKARALLDELGWKAGADGILEKEGRPLTLRYVDGVPNQDKRNDIAAMIQQQLKEIGIAVEITLTQDLFNVVVGEVEHDVMGTSNPTLDPSGALIYYQTQPFGYPSMSGYDHPTLDAWLAQAEVELEASSRQLLLENIQQTVIEQAISLPVYVPAYTVAASDQVRGLAFTLLGQPLLSGVSIQ